MIKPVIILSLLIVFLAAGTANAIAAYGYYDGFETMGEPTAMLLLGTGLIGVGVISRKTMMK